MNEPLLDVSDLHVDYAIGSRGRRRVVHAVNGVSLHIDHGETLGLVGESGSGKSTLGGTILGLVVPSSGRIRYRGEDITHATAARRRELAHRIQIVFQDPYGSLNPSRTIGSTLAEPLRLVSRLPKPEAVAKVITVLAQVGMPPDTAARYPGAFSGGQRQRIAIARALILEPELLICDEPTSALDLSVQAQILNLLLDLQRQLGLSYLFITHDIDVVRHMAHRVAVLHNGEVAEQGTAEHITTNPEQPYTRRLLAAAAW